MHPSNTSYIVTEPTATCFGIIRLYTNIKSYKFTTTYAKHKLCITNAFNGLPYTQKNRNFKLNS
jgi:hypothetical protein